MIMVIIPLLKYGGRRGVGSSRPRFGRGHPPPCGSRWIPHGTTLCGLRGGPPVWVGIPGRCMGIVTDRTRRKQRAETRLAQLILVVESTNNAQSFSVDNDHRRTEMGATSRPCRIQWTRVLDADLVRCNDAITLPRGSGRQCELVRCWLELHPMLPASGAALLTRL